MELYKHYTKKVELLSSELIEAVMTNNVGQLKCLHDAGEQFNLRDTQGNSLLHLAIMGPSDSPTFDAFDYLLTLDEIPKNSTNSRNNTPLFEAFIRESQTFALKLIKSGCDISIEFRDGNTPLHCAIKNGWIEVAELLIENGVFVDAVNEQGKTPLKIACCFELVDEIWMLLFYGADPNLASCFDICAIRSVSPQIQTIFLDDLIYKNTRINLATFTALMINGDEENFFKVYEHANGISFESTDAASFASKVGYFKSKLFELFIDKYHEVVIDVLRRRYLETVFSRQNDTNLHNYINNLYILFQSKLSSFLIQSINYATSRKQDLLFYVIDSCARFDRTTDTTARLFYFLFSIGLDTSSDCVNAVFYHFGFCQLFKMMLHLDIVESHQIDFLVPQIMYNVKLTRNVLIKKIIEFNFLEKNIQDIFRYFALPTMVKRYITKHYFRNQPPLAVKHILSKAPVVPSLLELSRNSFREHIIRRFKIKNNRKLYKILKMLQIAKIHEQILTYETQLYFFD